MNNICLKPKETSDALIVTAQNKLALTLKKRMLMSIMAGMVAIFDHSLTIYDIIFKNFIPAAVGNFIGGGILVPMMYYRVYHK